MKMMIKFLIHKDKLLSNFIPKKKHKYADDEEVMIFAVGYFEDEDIDELVEEDYELFKSHNPNKKVVVEAYLITDEDDMTNQDSWVYQASYTDEDF